MTVVLCVLLVVLVSTHGCEAVNEHLVEKDAPGLDECTSETCYISRHLLPILIRENELHRADSVWQKRKFQGKLHGEMIKTNFTCDDKLYIPGFYADMETGCQVFHVCMKNSVDHFVCPNGTGFDQKYFICSPDGKKYCNVSAPGYIMNLRVPDTFPVISGVEGYDLNWDRASHHYKQLKEYQSKNPDVLEKDLIRLLVLLQFMEVSHVLLDMVTDEDTYAYKGEARTLPLFSSVLESMLFDVFPLLPENYSSEPRVPLDHLDSGKVPRTGPKQSVARSPETSWDSSHKSEPELPEEGEAPGRPSIGEAREKSERTIGSSEDTNRKALKIIKTIVDVIADVSGEISPVSRDNLVWNYVKYLNFLSSERIQRSSPPM